MFDELRKGREGKMKRYNSNLPILTPTLGLFGNGMLKFDGSWGLSSKSGSHAFYVN